MALFDWLRPKTEHVIEPEIVQRLAQRNDQWSVEAIDSLRVRVERLEREMKAIDAEWSEWFDKFRHMYARLAKRIKDADGSERAQEPPSSTIAPPPSPGHHQWIGGTPRNVVGDSPRRRNY